MKLIVRHASLRNSYLGLVYGIIGLIGFLLAIFYHNILLHIPPCMFLINFGIPCPACGASRSGIALAHLHIWESIRINPLFFIIYIALIVWFANSLLGLIYRQKITAIFNKKEENFIKFGIPLAVLVNWLYLVLVSFR